MLVLLEMIQPMRIPGDCSPFVQAPERKTLLLSRSPTNSMPLTEGEWNISYASSSRMPLPGCSAIPMSSRSSSPERVWPDGF